MASEIFGLFLFIVRPILPQVVALLVMELQLGVSGSLLTTCMETNAIKCGNDLWPLVLHRVRFSHFTLKPQQMQVTYTPAQLKSLS